MFIRSVICSAILGTAYSAIISPSLAAGPSLAIVEHVAEWRGADAVSSIAWGAYASAVDDPVALRSLPIGIFDSGIGGLTVLEAILKLDQHHNDTGAPGGDGRADFEGERFIYLGDQANMPYGNYPSAGRVDFLRELIVRDALFLLGDRFDAPNATKELQKLSKPPVKAIVIACNTATAYGLDDIRTALERWKIPALVVGVVEAGGRGVIDAMRHDTTQGAAAILATVGTCSSEAYPKTIARLAGQQGLQAPAVCQQGCVGLAGAIEGSPAFIAAARTEGGRSPAAVEYLGPSGSHEQARIDAALMQVYGFDPAGLLGDSGDVANLRLNSVENYIRYDVATLVAQHRARPDAKPITTVVLGCTHYPLAVAQIDAAFRRLRNYRDAAGAQPYADLIAEKITYVDPGEYTARELYRGLFLRKQLLRAGEECVLSNDQCFVTVASPTLSADKKDALGNLTAEYKYSRAAGDMTRADVLTVPMAANKEAAAAVSAWFHKLPHVGKRFVAGKR